MKANLVNECKEKYKSQKNKWFCDLSKIEIFEPQKHTKTKRSMSWDLKDRQIKLF